MRIITYMFSLTGGIIITLQLGVHLGDYWTLIITLTIVVVVVGLIEEQRRSHSNTAASFDKSIGMQL